MKGTVMDIAVELMQILALNWAIREWPRHSPLVQRCACGCLGPCTPYIHMVPALSHCNDIIITSLGWQKSLKLSLLVGMSTVVIWCGHVLHVIWPLNSSNVLLWWYLIKARCWCEVLIAESLEVRFTWRMCPYNHFRNIETVQWSYVMQRQVTSHYVMC